MRFPKDIMSNLLLVWCIRLVYVRATTAMLIITTVDEWIQHQTVETHAFLGPHVVFVVVFISILIVEEAKLYTK